MTKPTAEQAREGGQSIVNCRVAAIEKAGGTFKKIAKELCLIAFSDMADFVHISEGGLVEAYPLDTLAKGKSRIIRKVKEKRTIRTEKGTESKPDGDQILDSTYEFELYDKMEALKYLCRLRGDEVQKVDINGGLVVYKPTEEEVLELREIAIERARKAIEALNE